MMTLTVNLSKTQKKPEIFNVKLLIKLKIKKAVTVMMIMTIFTNQRNQLIFMSIIISMEISLKS